MAGTRTTKDDEMYNLFNKIDTTYNVTADSINIPGNVNIAELNVGNLEATSTLSGNINIANMYTFDTSNFTSERITATKSLIVGGLDDEGVPTSNIDRKSVV